MNFRPAGESSDEDDEYNTYSMGGDYTTENERKEQMARKLLEERQQFEDLQTTKVYNAIIADDLDFVVQQLDNNFDIESQVFNQFTALHLAASLGRYKIVDVLLTRGANAKAEYEGFNVLMAACNCLKHTTTSENILHIVKKLIEFNVNVNDVDRKRRTALMLACEQGFIEVVEFLQPLSNIEAEDNQGWTAIFYAVESKNTEIIEFLYNIGADYNHTDIRNNNIKYYSTINEYYDIFKILPNDGNILSEELIQINYNYAEMFEYLENNYRPTFREDLSALLYGMRCESLIPLFDYDDVDLNSFLTFDDAELEMFGVKMSFQRNRILQGLYRFHERSWQKASIPFVARNDIYTTSDLFAIITTTVKHIVIMEATLDYLEKNYCFFNCDRLDLIALKIQEIQNKIKSMKVIVQHLHKRSKKFDKIGFHSDLITKQFSFKQNSLKKTIAMSLVGISTIFIVAFCRLIVK